MKKTARDRWIAAEPPRRFVSFNVFGDPRVSRANLIEHTDAVIEELRVVAAYLAKEPKR